MKKVKMFFLNLWKKFNKISYAESFRQIDRRIVFSALFDVLFFVSAIIIINLLSLFLNYAPLEKFALTQDISDFAGVKNFAYTASFILVLMFIMLVFAWSITRAWIYNRIYGNKFKWNVFSKFYLVNLLALSFLIFFLAVSEKIFTEQASPYVILLFVAIYSYKMSVFSIVFFRYGKFKVSSERMFSLLFGKIHILVPSFLIGLFTVIFVSGFFNMILSLLNFTKNAVTYYIITIFTISVMILCFAWMRNFIVIVINKILHDKN